MTDRQAQLTDAPYVLATRPLETHQETVNGSSRGRLRGASGETDADPNAGQLVKRQCAIWGHSVEGSFTK